MRALATASPGASVSPEASVSAVASSAPPSVFAPPRVEVFDDPEAARAALRSLPLASDEHLSRVEQMRGGLLFAGEKAPSEVVLVTGPSSLRKLGRSLPKGGFVSMTADAPELLFETADWSTGIQSIVDARGQRIWGGPGWLQAHATGQTLLVFGWVSRRARVTFVRTPEGYVERARYEYPVGDDLTRHLVDGVQIASLQSLSYRGASDDVVRTTWAGHPDDPARPLQPLSPRLPHLNREIMCRAGKNTAFMSRAGDDGYVFFHDGQAWSRGQRLDLQPMLASDVGSFACDERGASMAGQRLGQGYFARCTRAGCRTTELPELAEPTTDYEHQETTQSYRAAIGENLLEVRIVPHPQNAHGASIRYRFGPPTAMPSAESVLVSNAESGALRFAAVRLYGTSNGAVLRVLDRSAKPGTAFVFFDARGKPTVPAITP